MRLLFDDIARNDFNPKKRSESIFSYLNRSAREVISESRGIVEKLYSLFPENEGIRGRICKGDDIAFISAFTELYFQAIFVALGFDIKIHPKRKCTSTRPDWLVTDAAGERFYCEATSSFPKGESLRAMKLLDGLLDYLDEHLDEEIDSSLGIAMRGRPQPGLRPSQVRKEILDQIEEERNRSQGEDSVIELDEFTESSMDRVFVRPGRAKGARVVGSVGTGVEIVITHIRIRNRLRQKANLYKDFEIPFVIAVNVQDRYPPQDHDVEQALAGDDIVVSGEQGPRLAKKPNGFWGSHINPKYTRVSGILSVKNLSPFSVDRIEITLWHNPYAELPLDTSILPFRQMVMPDPESPNFETIPPQISPPEILRRVL